jgi:hypothetical protein
MSGTGKAMLRTRRLELGPFQACILVRLRAVARTA